MTKRVITLLAVLLFVGAEFVATLAQVAPPTNLTATVIGTTTHSLGVKLAWTPDTTHGIKYNVYRKEGGLTDTGAFRKIHTVYGFSANYYDYYIQLNKKYTYHVTAVLLNVESLPSNDVEALVGLPTPTVAKVTGNITDATTGLPIAHAYVNVFSAVSGHYNIVYTDSLGNYKVTVAAGDYYLYSSAMHYNFQYYNNVTTFANATKITLANLDSIGINVALIAYVAPTKYYVSGTAKDALGAVVKSTVTAYRLRSNSFHYMAKSVRTDSLGNFKLEVLQGDTVVVYACPTNKNFLPEFWENKSTFAEATRIAITGNVTGIDMILDAKPVYANGISGTISDTAAAFVAGHVTAYRTSTPVPGFPNRYTIASDSLGNYALANLAPGQYILLVHPQGQYRPTYFKYDGTSTLNWRNADSVVVDASTVVTGINFIVNGCAPHGNASIVGNIAQTNGSIVEGSYVYAVDANNDVQGFAISNAQGKYVMNSLIPGQYSIVADKVGFNPNTVKSVTLNYQGSSTVNANITISPNTPTDVQDPKSTQVTSYELSQNYPNPFNPTTQIKYSIPVATNVVVKVYNVLGAEVATLVSGLQTAGSHIVTFNASQLASGVYLYKIQAGEFTATKKLVLMK